MKSIAVLGLILVVSACSPQGKETLKAVAHAMQSASPHYREAQEIPQRCASFGFKPGTPEFANCSLQLHEGIKTREAIANQQASQAPSIPVKSSFTCTTYGNRTSCN